MEYLEKFLTGVDLALKHGAGLSILLGLVIALAGTQWLKFILLNTHWLPDPERWILKTLSLPLGAVATFATWPAENGSFWVRIFLSLAVGAAAPYAYQLGTAVLYKVWPSLEGKLSVDPYRGAVPPVDRPGEP